MVAKAFCQSSDLGQPAYLCRGVAEWPKLAAISKDALEIAIAANREFFQRLEPILINAPRIAQCLLLSIISCSSDQKPCAAPLGLIFIFIVFPRVPLRFTLG